MALPPGAIGSAVREEKLACRARGVKSAFPICSSGNSSALCRLPISFTLFLA
jgi:hypothetical protein